MSDIQFIAMSIADLAMPGMRPKDLIAAVRERHPDVQKKTIVRAAFYAVITQADGDLEKAKRIQDAALIERSRDDVRAAADPQPRRKPKRRIKTKP